MAQHLILHGAKTQTQLAAELGLSMSGARYALLRLMSYDIVERDAWTVGTKAQRTRLYRVKEVYVKGIRKELKLRPRIRRYSSGPTTSLDSSNSEQERAIEL